MTFFQQNWFYTLFKKKTNKQTKYKQTNINNNNNNKKNLES